MHFLIDADSILYKAGCANETRTWYVCVDGEVVADFMYKADATEFVEEQDYVVEEVEYKQEKVAGPLKHSISNLKSILDKILRHNQCISWEVFIGGKNNFRYDVDPNYKSNRKSINRPIHEKELRDYLVQRYNATVVDGMEVDDLVSIECYQNPLDNIIVSIDKDLNNTPGWHYNYDKELMYYVDEEEADHNFYKQLLSGDSTDGIVGVKGIGGGKAADILPYPLTVERMCSIVWKTYQDKGYDWEYFIQQGQLLWMLRDHGAMWQPPLEEGAIGE